MNSKDRFSEQQKAKVREIEEILKTFLPKEEGYQKIIMEAMEYSLLAGGKRLRPMLMQETYLLFSGGVKRKAVKTLDSRYLVSSIIKQTHNIQNRKRLALARLS